MRIVVRSDQSVHLEDPDNFKDFKLLSYTAANDMIPISVALQNASAGKADISHGWISEGWLRTQKSDPAWQGALSNMLSFAQSKGWMNNSGAIRAHVEWL